jgi:dolichol-phosphate mannosyltransferase
MTVIKDLAVIIPIYNEAEIIDELCERLVNSVSKVTFNYELIFINDGSEDNSFVKLKHLAKINDKIYYVNLSRNFGHQIAVSAGLTHCNSKAVVIIDGDLQDPPELIPDLYAKYKNGYEVVYAMRKKRQGETFFKKLTAKWFYKILERITNFTIPFDVGDYRIIDKKIVDALNAMPEQNKFLRGQIAWLGFNQTHILFDRAERKAGKTGYSYSKMFRLAFDAITGFSDKPLRFVSRLGLVISLGSFLIILFAIFSYFVLDRTVTGWTSLIVSSAFIGGIQLLSVGVIGEYISRISNDVKNRPLYVVSETNLETNKKK